ncbi:MAG: GTP cyclohydrolase I FolE [Lentimicrobium sp.]|jgi:GTP cyclohydrolase I|nr:GTP cyclohydrolase I FolE [Lentimicrobium sp.]
MSSEIVKDMIIQNMMDDYQIKDGYEKRDLYNQKTITELAHHYHEILRLIGEDPDREGLAKTPERVAKAMQFLTHGYDLVPEEILRSAMFKEDYKQMVLVKDIEVYSMCEHHMIPFFGRAHVAYIPNGQIVGLSKIPRVVDAFARRLQVQERLTTQIKDAINNTLKPLGVAVVIEAQHMCMSMRGIQKQNSVTTTSDFTGAFLAEKTRAEFIHLIGSRLHG